jgi:hypothetical protein
MSLHCGYDNEQCCIIVPSILIDLKSKKTNQHSAKKSKVEILATVKQQGSLSMSEQSIHEQPSRGGGKT